MDRPPLQHIECFHLVLLRLLEARVDRAGWVVKGGVNLRAWFGSRRYSEDLDIDAVRGQPHVLEDRVDRLLASRPFSELLATQGLALARGVFKAQVVPYLTSEDQEVYGTPDAWARMRELVADRLAELAR